MESGIPTINEDYLREMEINSQLFEQKLKKLNRFQFTDTNNNNQPLQSPYMNPNNFTFKDVSSLSTQNTLQKQVDRLTNEVSYKDAVIKQLQDELTQQQKLSTAEEEFHKEFEQVQKEL